MDLAAAPAVLEAPPEPVPATPMTTAEDKPSLRQLFEAEEGPLLRFAHGLTGRREVAEDLVQEAFLRLHAHWDEVAHPKAWLYRSIRNLALNHLRDHKRESSDEAPDAADETRRPHRPQAPHEAAGAVPRHRAALKDEKRALIQLE